MYETGCTVTVDVSSSLRVRSGPSLDYDIIGESYAGDVLVWDGQTVGEWHRILHGNTVGWVCRSVENEIYLKVNKSPSGCASFDPPNECKATSRADGLKIQTLPDHLELEIGLLDTGSTLPFYGTMTNYYYLVHYQYLRYWIHSSYATVSPATENCTKFFDAVQSVVARISFSITALPIPNLTDSDEIVTRVLPGETVELSNRTKGDWVHVMYIRDDSVFVGWALKEYFDLFTLSSNPLSDQRTFYGILCTTFLYSLLLN